MDGNEMKVGRIDASSLAMGVTLEANGSIIEDACWLHPTNDARHINLAELDAALKGINLALQWQATVLHLVTDSACMNQWISDTLIGKAHVKTKATSEIFMRLCLGTLRALTEEYGLTINLTLVKSCQNHADCLTRLTQR